MDDDKIDFSALDPARDRLAWERRLRAVAAAVRPPTLSDALLGWARPALALAAGMALAVWVASALRPPTSAGARTSSDPAEQLASWAATGSVPAPEEALAALGVANGTR